MNARVEVGANELGRATPWLRGSMILLMTTMSPCAFAQAVKTTSTQDAAAETHGELDTIMVTAQRRQQNLQDVPVSVAAISSEQLTSGGVSSTAQLGSVTSSVTINVSAGAFSPYIRGVGTPAFGPGIENPVALYIDNVYYSSQKMALSDLSSVDQVAILKGPQGTLFGRNATGGVVQLSTRNPENHFGGELRTEIDQYQTSRSFLYLTGPINDDVRANLSVSYGTQGEGWGKNLFNGDEVHKIDHDVALRGKVHIDLTPTTLIKLNADYADTQGTLGPNLRPAPGTNTLLPGFTDGGNIYNVNSDITNYSKNKSYGGSGIVEQKIGDLRLVSITAYREYDFSTIFSVSVTPTPGFYIEYGSNGRQFSQEFQLLSPDDSKLTWMIGGFYFRSRDALTFFNNRFAIPPYSIPGLPPITRISNAGSVSTRSFAAFGQATLEVLPSTRVTAGLRYTSERRTLDDSVQTIFAGPVQLPTAFTPNPQKVNRPTWRLSVDHDFGNNFMGYASYNRGFKSGGYQVLTPSLPAYDPEKLDAYEVGFKTELFNRAIRFNPAAFYYDYTNIQLLRISPNAQVINAPAARIYGFDFEAEARVSDALRLTTSAAILNSKIKSFTNATCSAPIPGGGAAIVPCDASGNRIPYSPKFTFNVGATYDVDIAGAKVSFNANDSYNSGYFSETENVQRQSKYHILNGSITWTSPDDRLIVQAFLRNALDKAVSPYRSTSSGYGYMADFSQPPRTYGASIRYLFGS